jgi:hypothetical protein
MTRRRDQWRSRLLPTTTPDKSHNLTNGTLKALWQEGENVVVVFKLAVGLTPPSGEALPRTTLRSQHRPSRGTLPAWRRRHDGHHRTFGVELGQSGKDWPN